MVATGDVVRLSGKPALLGSVLCFTVNKVQPTSSPACNMHMPACCCMCCVAPLRKTNGLGYDVMSVQGVERCGINPISMLARSFIA